jgi:hypothetical protein
MLSNMSAVKKKKREPDIAAGRLAVVLGSLGLVLVICFISRPGYWGHKMSLAGFALTSLAWGRSEIAAAKKKKQREEDAKRKMSSITPTIPPKPN